MKKRLSKTMLVVVLGLMITTSVSIGLINKNDYNVIDIKGNRNELGDMNLVYQMQKGYYETNEVVINKDSEIIKKYAKEVNHGIPISKIAKNNREMYNNSSVLESAYKDDEVIGNIAVNMHSEDYSDENSKMELVAYVDQKDLQTNKISSYQIPLELYFNCDIGLDNSAVAVRYDGELYLIMGINIEPSYIYDKKMNIGGSKDCMFTVHKLDLENENAEHIRTKKISTEEGLTSINTGMGFSHDNSAYIMSQRNVKNKDEKYESKFELLKYDVKNRNFATIGSEIKSNEINSPNIVSIDGDKAIFLQTDYDVKSSCDIIYKTVIDLKSDKVLESNIEYKIKNEEKNFTYYIRQSRVVDGKIYLAVSLFENTNKVKVMNPINKNYIYVIDEKSKEVLYIGKINEGIRSNTNISILKDEEL